MMTEDPWKWIDGLAAKVSLLDGRSMFGTFRLEQSGRIEFEGVGEADGWAYVPDLSGPFKLENLLAVAVDGRVLTLIGTYRASCQIGGSDVCRVRLAISQLVAGLHMPDLRAPVASWASAAPAGLCDFVGHQGFEFSSGDAGAPVPTRFDYRRMPKQSSVVERPGSAQMRVELDDSVSIRHQVMRSRELATSKLIRVTYASPMALRHASEDLMSVCRLVSLLSGNEAAAGPISFGGFATESSGVLLSRDAWSVGAEFHLPLLRWAEIASCSRKCLGGGLISGVGSRTRLICIVPVPWIVRATLRRK